MNITENYLKFKVKITILWQHIDHPHRLLFQAIHCSNLSFYLFISKQFLESFHVCKAP